MSRKIKVAVIGLGRIGMPVSFGELGYFTELYEIVGACDLIADRRAKIEEKFGCKTYERIEDLLSETDAELIYIATRSCDHYDHAIMALNAGKNVVLEKPVTISYAQAVDLFAHANAKGLKLFVHQQRRFETAFRKMYEIVNSGVLGKVYEVNTEQNGFQHRDDWQTLSQYGGGQLLNWGPHIIDQSLQFLGTKTYDIQSYLHQVTAGGDCEDHLRIRFIGDNNRVVNMSISGATALKQGRHFEAYGDRGSAICDNGKIKVKYNRPDIVIPEVVSSPETPGAAFGKSGTYESAIKIDWVEEEYDLAPQGDYMCAKFWEFLYDSLVSGAPFPVTQDDILAIMRTISTVKTQNKYIRRP